MAASDSTISFADTDVRVYIEDGASNSIEINPRLGSITWEQTAKEHVEVKHRNKHQTTPVIRVTGSGMVTGTLRASACTFYGSTAATPKEALMGEGLGAAWTNTASGDAVTRKIRIVSTNPSSGGATQTHTFAYVVCDSVSVDMGGEEGTSSIDFSFTDHEDAPTVS